MNNNTRDIIETNGMFRKTQYQINKDLCKGVNDVNDWLIKKRR